MHVCSPIFSPSFLIMKMHGLWFFTHVSISGMANNIKIICSIRFSLLITIDRFYKLFLQRVLSWIVDFWWSPLFFIPPEPYPARSARHLPHAGKALSVVILFLHMRVFALTMREKRYPRIAAFPIGKVLPGETVFSFLHPFHKKRPSLTSGRFYMYYLLRETLIKSQNSISHVFSCNASSYSSLNSSLFASEYSLHCMKI